MFVYIYSLINSLNCFYLVAPHAPNGRLISRQPNADLSNLSLALHRFASILVLHEGTCIKTPQLRAIRSRTQTSPLCCAPFWHWALRVRARGCAPSLGARGAARSRANMHICMCVFVCVCLYVCISSAPSSHVCVCVRSCVSVQL